MPLLRNPVRQRIVNQCWWGIAHTSRIHYAQTRPIPLERYKARELPITTDCSGYATCCYYAAGAPDPNGLNYNGAGFTGTMLGHLSVIEKWQARPGDLVVFGAFPGDHVCVILEAGDDPLLASHGGEVGPLDLRLSQELPFHSGKPVTYLRGVTMFRRRRSKKLIILADGKPVSHGSGVWRWVTRHRRLAKRWGDELTFKRVKAQPKHAANRATHKDS